MGSKYAFKEYLMRHLTLMLILLFYHSPYNSDCIVSAQTIDDINFRSIYEKEGEQGLRPYIKEVADSVLAILEVVSIEGNYLGEGNGERLLSYLRVLSYAGDMSSKEALLNAMISPQVGGDTIARGLMRLGPQVQPEIIAYLFHDNREYRIGTIDTLKRMARIDTAGTFLNKDFREKIREKLDTMLADSSQSDAGLTRSAIGALADFGDESDIPLLEKLSKEDIPGLVPAVKSPNLRYIPNTPQEVIEYLQEKK
jgi:hypothetical protein